MREGKIGNLLQESKDLREEAALESMSLDSNKWLESPQTKTILKFMLGEKLSKLADLSEKIIPENSYIRDTSELRGELMATSYFHDVISNLKTGEGVK